MIKVLFICHGNICRSPMAEFILKDMAQKAGKAGAFEIASAATSTEEIGNGIYPPARRELERHGIHGAHHRARQITQADMDDFDRIYYMDGNNLCWLKRLFPGSWRKCAPLLNRDVADPWYTGDFETTWNDLCEGCRSILEELGR